MCDCLFVRLFVYSFLAVWVRRDRPRKVGGAGEADATSKTQGAACRVGEGGLGFRFQRVQDLCVRTLGFGRPRPYKGRAEWFERMLSLCTIARLRGCAPIQLPMPG